MDDEMKCQLRFIGRTKGSVCLSQGKTTVSASVVGPFESKASTCMYYRDTVDLTLKRINSTAIHEELYESVMQFSCESSISVESYARATIAVTVQELQNRGNLLSTGINASCLALINSGISMNQLFASVSCAITEDEDIILHPNESEINSSASYLTFTFTNSKTREMLTSQTLGKFSKSTYSQCLDRCYVASKDIFKFYEHLVVDKLLFK